MIKKDFFNERTYTSSSVPETKTQASPVGSAQPGDSSTISGVQLDMDDKNLISDDEFEKY